MRTFIPDSGRQHKMTQRPKMHARDSSGRSVSLLNDEPAEINVQFRPSPFSAYDPSNMIRSTSSNSAQSRTSSPLMPDLVRADSFDSNNTNDPLSPATPTFWKESGRPSSYLSYKAANHFDYREPLPRIEDYSTSRLYALPAPAPYSIRPPYPEPQMYDEDHYQGQGPPERGPKRYPCRHRDTHNCDKTFTTSGHASRHSKIHTAEKGVVCTWEGCQKKFTRGDNMKQHLETHTKERSRASAAQKHAVMRTLTVPSGVRKSVSLDSRPSSRNTNASADCPVDPALLQQPQQPRTSPFVATSTPYLTSPVPSPRGSMPSGLDALASIAADSRYRS